MSRMSAGQRYIRCAGSLGWAFPAALGAKAALPNTPVIGFAGDAGFYYHMAEMETAARCGLNAVMVVNNNYSGGVAESAAFEKSVNFAKVADFMGCVGFRVEKATEIRGTLDKSAFALAAGRRSWKLCAMPRYAQNAAERRWGFRATSHIYCCGRLLPRHRGLPDFGLCAVAGEGSPMSPF